VLEEIQRVAVRVEDLTAKSQLHFSQSTQSFGIVRPGNGNAAPEDALWAALATWRLRR